MSPPIALVAFASLVLSAHGLVLPANRAPSSPLARHAAPRAGLFGFGKKEAAPPPSGRAVAAGHELTVGADHVDVTELRLSSGQRKKLAKAAAGGRVERVTVGGDVEASAAEVQEHLAKELVHCEFVTCEKKADAMLLANALAAQCGAAVAECVGNTALLYR